jgi:hypothetical protein
MLDGLVSTHCKKCYQFFPQFFVFYLHQIERRRLIANVVKLFVGVGISASAIIS